MNEELGMRNEELKAKNAAAEKLLGDILEIVEDAISDSTGKPEETRAMRYASAIGKICVMLGEAGTERSKATAPTFNVEHVSLPELYLQKFERLGETWGLHVSQEDTFCLGDHNYKAKIFREGKCVSVQYYGFGLCKARSAAIKSMKQLMFKCEKIRRRTLRKQQKSGEVK